MTGAHPVSNIETADLDASLRAAIKKEGIAALTFIPLVVKGELIGKFMTYYPVQQDFSEAYMNFAITIARQPALSLDRMQIEEQRQQAEGAKELLLQESTYRIKNTLAPAQAIAGQTLRHTTKDELNTYLARLHALAEAHDLLITKKTGTKPPRAMSSTERRAFASTQNRIAAKARL
jgi:GAF domain-containing protein